MRSIIRATAYALGILALLALSGAQLSEAKGAQNRAGLVVQFGDGSVRSYCIAFTGDSITGMELLLKSGLDVKAEGFGGMGGMVCKIGPDGCDYPGEACVCESYGPQGVYWSYHHLRDGVWKTSAQGAGGYRVLNGEVDGWAWSAGKPPAVRTFGQICGSTQVQATATVKPAIIAPHPPLTTTPKRPVPTAIATRQTTKPSNTARAATQVSIKTKPTSTKQTQPARPSPTKTATRKATATRQAPQAIPSATPRKVGATPTKRPSMATPTRILKAATPTKARISTPIATRTRTVSVPTRSSTPTRTSTLTPTRTPTQRRMVDQAGTPATLLITEDPPRPASPDAQSPATDIARTVSIAIGATILVGLLVWGGVKLAMRRGISGRQRRSQRVG